MHYLALLQDWYVDQNKQTTAALIQYIYDASNLQVVNNKGLLAFWRKYINKFQLEEPLAWTALNPKLNSTRDYSFVQPLTLERVEENFKADCDRYGAHKLDYIHMDIPQLAAVAHKAGFALMTSHKVRKTPFTLSQYLWCEAGKLTVRIPKDSKFTFPFRSAELPSSEQYPFIQLVNNETGEEVGSAPITAEGQATTFDIPTAGAYRLTINRTHYGVVTLEGRFFLFRHIRHNVMIDHTNLLRDTSNQPWKWFDGRVWHDGTLDVVDNKMNTDWILFVDPTPAAAATS